MFCIVSKFNVNLSINLTMIRLYFSYHCYEASDIYKLFSVDNLRADRALNLNVCMVDTYLHVMFKKQNNGDI